MKSSFCDIENLIFDIRKWIIYINTNIWYWKIFLIFENEIFIFEINFLMIENEKLLFIIRN